MSENTVNVLAAVDSVLGGKELKDQPRAFLLLRLCQLSLLVSPDQAESYWNRLAALQSRVPQEAQADLQNLRAVVESTSTAEAKKGFAAEVMADIEAARKTALSDAEGAKRLLHECEERLNKRRWPFGKTPVQIVLVETWASVDRLYALQLIGTIPANVRESLLRRMNQARVLTAEEWQIVADKVGMDQAAQIVLKMLDDDQPRLILPGKAVLEVGTRIRNSMKPLTTAQQEGNWSERSNATPGSPCCRRPASRPTWPRHSWKRCTCSWPRRPAWSRSGRCVSPCWPLSSNWV